MKQTYILSYTTDLKIVGGLPQLDFVNCNYGINKESSFIHIEKNWNDKSFKPDLINCFKFKHLARGRQTDILSVSFSVFGSAGILVSDRFRDILLEYKLWDYKIYDMLIPNHKAEFHYNYMHFMSNDSNLEKMFDAVDFPECKLIGRRIINEDPYEEIKEDVFFQDKEAYRDFYFDRSKAGLIVKKLALKEEYKDYDLFKNPLASGGMHIHISERLKNRLEEEKITGITMTPTTEFRVPYAVE
ncbi:hypothetical protein SAMN04515674_11766 [Pseudarcicella hirudinis]|uniref:Immunity protein 43 n=1 Tax=Pseudarcicella hirudinis TaxID=1079859 RepID=A0A1I5Y7A4_9BACT|nr:hypothetical protein [Pseudarcicella hirudinis]SFQ40053.1 hypothetical protein SAMN04515674_11766 [Pseudarcicella hirudinis]